MLYFVRISYKAYKSEADKKRNSRSRLVEQVFLQSKITNCPISGDFALDPRALLNVVGR